MTTVALLTFVTQFAGLRVLTKFLPHPWILTPLAVLAAAGAFLLLTNPPRPLRGPLKRLLGTPWPAVSALAALAVAALVVYPLADARKMAGGGSDADDALIIAGTQILHGRSPYLLKTYFGNSLSPGPGWALLAAPFSALGLEPLLPLPALASILVVLRSWPQRNRFALALSACPLVWELAATGNDVLPLGLFLTAATLALLGVRHAPTRLALAALLGTLATGRVVLAAWPLLTGFLLAQQSHPHARRDATVATLVAIMTCLAWHAVFMAATPGPYAPLHVLGKGARLFGSALLVPVALVLAATAVYMVRNARTLPATTLLALGVAVPFALLAFAELANHGFDTAAWEGATYFIPALPAALVALCPDQEGPRREDATGVGRAT